jgi:hypothetical protein
VHARNGGVIIPPIINGEYDYTKNFNVISVSENSPKKEIEGQHFDTMTTGQQRPVLDYLALKGYTLEEVRTDYKKRDELNIIYFLDLEKAIPPWPRPFTHKVNKGFGL